MGQFNRILSTLALSALLGACTTPYAIPVIDTGGMDSTSSGFDGLRQILTQGDTRIFWVHGMCTHDRQWAIDRYRLLTTALGVRVTLDNVAKPKWPSPEVLKFPSVNIGDFSLTASYAIWSPFNAETKADLEYDRPVSEGGEFPYVRARLNNTLKVGLINDCLIDAVAYTGPAGERIKWWMREQVCLSLGGSFVGRSCGIPDHQDTTQTVLIAESLGSKMLFDAVDYLWTASPSRGQQLALASRLAKVQSIFLLANQIPLLDAAGGKGPRLTSLSDGNSGIPPTMASFLATMRDARTHDVSVNRFGPPSAPLRVIAFTDPNDLLSYRLPKRALRIAGAEVVNVIVSNDTTYLGLVERPDTAHQGYEWNPSVTDYIANGCVASASGTRCLTSRSEASQ